MRSSNSKQPFLNSNETPNVFASGLCKALISANIPLWKLQNSAFRSFLEKISGKSIPDESTLRKNYMKKNFLETMERIKTKIGKAYVYAMVDETTDLVGRYVANLLVGKLECDKFTPPSLISVKMLERTNYSTISRFVNDGLS
uniref:DUF659 domain-containing protein n=1 Tax=Meloidogyne hapla TaxID=6305 RepID=A0A1I8BQU2_MELHA